MTGNKPGFSRAYSPEGQLEKLTFSGQVSQKRRFSQSTLQRAGDRSNSELEG